MKLLPKFHAEMSGALQSNGVPLQMTGRLLSIVMTLMQNAPQLLEEVEALIAAFTAKQASEHSTAKDTQP